MRAGAKRAQQLAGILLDLVDRQHDQRFAGNVCNADDVGRDKRVAEWQPEAIRRGLEDFRLQRHAVAQIGDDHDGNVEFAPDEKVFEIPTIVLDRGYLDTGARAAISSQQVGQHVAGDQRCNANIKRAADRVALPGKTGAGVGNGRKDLRRVA
jgi:hypothetical protein